MNRFELYKLVSPNLLLLNVTGEDYRPFLRNTLCSIKLFKATSTCDNCSFFSSGNEAFGNCLLDLRNESAKQLLADLKIKHPELFV
jgi:hypothetical protein